MASQMTNNTLSDAAMPTPSAAATPRTTAEHLLDRVFAVIERIWAGSGRAGCSRELGGAVLWRVR
jgi:hypothetical protein